MKVLVLDKAWLPNRVVTWKRAMTWVFQERVDVIHFYDDVVSSAKEDWFVPSVIRMRAGQTHKARIVRFSRTGVWNRDNGECQYCGKDVPLRDLTLDHIVPRSQGGPTTWANVTTCCFSCNQKKGSKSLEECGFSIRNYPTKPTTADMILRDISKVRDLPDVWKPYLPNHDSL